MTPENGRKVEALLQEVSSILLSEDMVRGGDWTFKGWTNDGRAVAHRIKIEGYERTGPTVERERAQRDAG